MTSKSDTAAGQRAKKTTGLDRSRQQENTTSSRSKTKSVKLSKAKATRDSPTKKRKLDNIIKNIAGNASHEEISPAITFIKLKTKEAREPSGLMTPLSTSDYDMYVEKMPEDIGNAVNESIEIWLSQVESAAEHKRRVELYGEDVADAFPSGGTPGFAKRLKESDQKGVESN